MEGKGLVDATIFSPQKKPASAPGNPGYCLQNRLRDRKKLKKRIQIVKG